MAADAALDEQLALPFGYPHGGLALWTAEETEVLPLGETNLQVFEPAGKSALCGQIPGVFPSAFFNVLREHPKAGQHDAHHGQQFAQGPHCEKLHSISKQRNQQKSKSNCRKKAGKLVNTVSAVEKSNESVTKSHRITLSAYMDMIIM